MEIRELRSEELRRTCNPDDIPDLAGGSVNVLGQSRTKEALQLALEIREDIFNLWITGSSELGKTTLVKEVLAEVAPKQERPQDLCYVFNFLDPRRPKPIFTSAGEAQQFKKAVRKLVRYFLSEMNKFDPRDMWMKARQLRHNKINKFNQDFEDQNFRIVPFMHDNSEMIKFCYVYNGTELLRPEIEGHSEISQEEKKKILKRYDEVYAAEYKVLFTEIRELVENVDKKIDDFKKEEIIAPAFKPLMEKYSDNEPVLDFLAAMEEDIKENLGWFEGGCRFCQQQSIDKCPVHSYEGIFFRYEVYVLVDHTKTKGAPVVVEQVNTFEDIFGSIDMELAPQQGGGGQPMMGYSSDHTMINPGVLHKANGGYLVLKGNDLLAQPFPLQACKKLVDTLKSGKLEVENLAAIMGGPSVIKLKPEAVPLNIRLILISDDFQRHILLNLLDGLLNMSRVFKVKGQMEKDMPYTPENAKELYLFLGSYCEKQGIPPLNKEALARVDEFTSETAGHQEKLTLELSKIKILLKEAGHYAKKAKRRKTSLADIEHALTAKIKRNNFFEEKIHEFIKKGIIKISNKGVEPGQINALSVYVDPEHQFGRPSRVTATVSLGKEGVVSIDREVKMAGRIHNKGEKILDAGFRAKFGNDDFPLTFNASLCFEQQYGLIDGDSASSTELYALLSAFADEPIDQGIAVTGSVNQKWEVQAIGGENQKIEGFFKICKAFGLTKEQGVMIPEDNLKGLMLDKEIVEAVEKGEFHIWPVSTIEQGIEILTGKPFDVIQKKVRKRLKKMAETVRDFNKGGSS